MSASDTVSVIIVTCNSLSAIHECLRVLQRAIQGVSAEVIIVDNASTDATVAEIQSQYPSVTVICNERNEGFAAACNRGAATANSEYLLFLNPDVELDSDAIAHLLAAARSVRRPGLIAGRLRFSDGAFQANCRKFPTITNLLFSRGSLLGRLLLNRITSSTSIYSLPDYGDVTEVPAVAATMVLIRRELFQRVRGFDSRFFLYMEDTDLSLRLHQAGFANLFVPRAGGVHGLGLGSQVSRVRRSWHQHQSVWRYFLKHFPNGFSLILLPAFLTVNFLLSAIMPSPHRR